MFTAEDKAFIRTILANPAELTSWLVYADWLDEHENPLHAEFLRLEVRRSQLDNALPEWHAVEERLKELRVLLNPNWVVVFDRPKIENCSREFETKCPKQWENLKVTGDPAVRHCTACGKDVYFCHTFADAQAHAAQGHCVAVRLDVPRSLHDLKSPDTIMIEQLLGGPEAANELFARMFAQARRPWWKFW